MPELRLAHYSIAVDDVGILADTVFEGALGFVARVLARDGTPRALKIPRLLADTDRENHYVCSLTEYEVANAALLVNKPGLTSLDFGGQSLLRSLSFVGGRQEAAIVQFSKELRPRFCLISAEVAEERLIFTPHLENLASWLTFDMWQEAVRASQGGGSALTATVVLRRRAGTAEAAVRAEPFLLAEQQIGRDQPVDAPEDTWYLGLPSPVYFWREGTLEQAVRKGQRGEWEWDHHCLLCSQLASGLLSLYQKNFVHGDLRPANIMYGGRPELASDYALVDYSSYSGLAGALANPAPTEAAGQTLVGVAVAEARQSPFYPVERRVGRERENCDTVVIRRSNGMWNIHVGYRSEMFGESTDQLHSVVEEQMKLVVADQQRDLGQQQASKEWKPGDRIRIRDFVFQVDGWKSGARGFSMVSKLAWIVHNNRILVPLDANAFEGKDRVLSVSRTFPIWQWSMATDFFSLGVTLLYSLFFARDLQQSSDSDAGGLDSDFEAMIAVMSSVQYAGVILPNVASLARLLESIWSDEEFRDQSQFTPNRVAKLGLTDESEEARWAGTAGDRSFAPDLDLKDNQFLLGRTWAIAMSVVQTTPGAQRVLRAVKHNLAVFVCLIDLAMQLMHRVEDLSGVRARLMPWMCRDRTTPPEPSNVQALIVYILAATRGLQQRFESASEFVCPEKEVLPYSSRNETLLLIQMRDLEGRLENMRTELEETKGELEKANVKLMDARAAMEGLTFKNRDIKNVLREIGSKDGEDAAEE